MKKLALLLLTGIVLCGCTEKNIMSDSGPVTPETETKSDIVIEWTQVMDDVQEEVRSNEDYTGVVDCEIGGNPEGTIIQIKIVVDDGMTNEAVKTAATELLKFVGDDIASQDFSYAVSGPATYGGYFDTHTVRVKVAPQSTADDEATWYVNQEIAAGSNAEIELLNKALK